MAEYGYSVHAIVDMDEPSRFLWLSQTLSHVACADLASIEKAIGLSIEKLKQHFA